MGRRDFDRDYGGASSVRAARVDVTQWMDAHGADHDAAHRAVLIVSELASNAVQASPGTAYHVRLSTVDRSTLDICVSNRRPDDRSRPPESLGPVAPHAPMGRGLSIVESLSHAIAIEVTDDEVHVSAICPVHTLS
jgi:anti-sigma regulatory factor (Ser/Thr protein kinase)